MTDITSNLEAPAGGGVVIDVSGGNQTLEHTARSLYVGTSGDVKVKMRNGNDITFVNVQNGQVLPIRFTLVYQTGTDADNMVALW